ncbi:MULTISPECIES: DUF2470 domain-containing protein [Actinomadura]|uniref:DUF2470 domain-containing protein n=1 Tax=Actinomadura yumaensis TaxID=111807 RepID=A0ABW2CP09_9ACTN|nr:DUF2470 domain-containing protein [Actinomadura sp. J1-007]
MDETENAATETGVPAGRRVAGGPAGAGAPGAAAVVVPTAAERARTLAYGVSGAVLVTPGHPDDHELCVPAHATDRNGRPLLLIPASSQVVAALSVEADVPAVLRIADVAPVPLPDRVRGRAWLHGWVTEIPAEERRAAALRLSRLHPRPELLGFGGASADTEWALLALEVAQVEIDDAWGSATIEPEEYAAAEPDPFVAVEGGILSHLDSRHRGELTGLLPWTGPEGGCPAGREDGCGDGAQAPSPTVRPLSLDRYGMWLRCLDAEADGSEPFDLRLAFAEPVSDLHGLRRVYRRLFAAGGTWSPPPAPHR